MKKVLKLTAVMKNHVARINYECGWEMGNNELGLICLQEITFKLLTI